MEDSQVTVEDIYASLQEIKALLLQMKTKTMIKTRKDRIMSIISHCKENGELTTTDVQEMFGVSNRVAISYMRDATNYDDKLVFYKGFAGNPSKVLRVNEENKFDIIAVGVIQEMKIRGRGATKRIRSIMYQYKLTEDELHKVIQRIVKYSQRKIVIANPESNKPFIYRRLTYRGGL